MSEHTPETLEQVVAYYLGKRPGALRRAAAYQWAYAAARKGWKAAERRAEEAETWWPKPWPREFDGPVIVFAPSADPHRPLKTVAWWDGESLTHIPFVWVDAVTHIRPMPRGPEPDDAPASPPEEAL